MYERFNELDGDHPWRDAAPDGFVDYRARIRSGGKVVYFNYALAREMELIPANHAARLTPELEKSILEAFSIQIINEYDLAKNTPFAARSLKLKPFMATRYLQAQHRDKRGMNSGDGRSIWNGFIKTSRLTYDVSSRGTGATCLSPGAQLADGPVATGDEQWGYCSGTADLDEMLGTAVMSEIFYQNGFPTERTLAVIDCGDGHSIGVRASHNLLRPAHIFRFLKQGRREETKAAMDYFLARQVENEHWKLPGDEAQRYARALEYVARSYGQLAAILEEEYIFHWLAWDGDNMLAHGAILDYGSIRQFAAKHDKYRFDDVDRFSSTLTEQRFWARELVKVFAQAIHFIRTGKKPNLREFKNARCLKQFDESFESEREWRTLWRLGFSPEQIAKLRKTGKSEIIDLRRALSFFETQKIARGMEKLSDGITHSPVFLIRNLLRKLPAYYVNECGSKFGAIMEPDEFCRTMIASYASRRDMRLTTTRATLAKNFQKCYQRLIAAAGPYEQVLKQMAKRSQVINFEHRITGNAMIGIATQLMEVKDKVTRNDLQTAMDRFIESQILIPERWRPLDPNETTLNTAKSRLLNALMQELEQSKETV
jgi:uncharacterized protein YdiU (UPF0061 family)